MIDEVTVGPGLHLADPERPDGPGIDIRALELLDRAGVVGRVGLAPSDAGARGSAEGWTVELVLAPEPALPAGWSGTLAVRWGGADPVERGIRLPLTFPTGGEPTWLIPGCFHGENRPARCTRRFPRFERDREDAAEMVASAWALRADRAAVPFVMGWSGGVSATIGLPDGDPPEGVGFGFAAAGPDGAPRIWVDLPAREEPVTFDGSEHARPATARLARWEPGQVRSLHLVIAVGGSGPDAADPLLRAMERWGARGWAPAPWVDAEGAARLAAEGLLRWHLRPDPPRLIETATFDRDLAGDPIVGEDRPNMHVAWLSGIPCAGPLLAWGRRTGDAAAIDGATAVLDHIATGLSPGGLFWGEWRDDRGWSGGWNPSNAWIHVRTAGEATLFLGRTLAAEAAAGHAHPTWETAWRSNLDAIAWAAGEDGRLGTYVDSVTGRVMESAGTGGLVWIPALLEAADRVDAAGEEVPAARWRAVAMRAGAGYAADVTAGRLAGAPEDVHLAPSSEDGYGAIMAYTALAEREPDDALRTRWLALARRAATWTMAFRLTHDVRWPHHTIMERYGFRARGTDIASPSNQHLHAYGLVCVPEQLRLARLLDDPWLARRARDHVLAWRQLIARADGDLNARRGMVTERVYHTDCFGPKGALLPLSHAWCLGLILGAALHELDHPEEHVDAS